MYFACMFTSEMVLVILLKVHHCTCNWAPTCFHLDYSLVVVIRWWNLESPYGSVRPASELVFLQERGPRGCKSPVSAVLNQSDRVLINTLWSPITQASALGLHEGEGGKKNKIYWKSIPLSPHSRSVWRNDGNQSQEKEIIIETEHHGQNRMRESVTRGILEKHNHAIDEVMPLKSLDHHLLPIIVNPWNGPIAEGHGLQDRSRTPQ